MLVAAVAPVCAEVAGALVGRAAAVEKAAVTAWKEESASERAVSATTREGQLVEAVEAQQERRWHRLHSRTR